MKNERHEKYEKWITKQEVKYEKSDNLEYWKTKRMGIQKWKMKEHG